jgi:RHS repeat-associated protein
MNDTGGLLSQNRYMPFGKVRDITGSDDPIDETDFGYTGQRNLADIGLMDYNARFYSATLGRFIQPDTIISNLGHPQSFNRYSYVMNSPIMFNDLTGHVCTNGMVQIPGTNVCTDVPIPSMPTSHTNAIPVHQQGTVPRATKLRQKVFGVFVGSGFDPNLIDVFESGFDPASWDPEYSMGTIYDYLSAATNDNVDPGAAMQTLNFLLVLYYMLSREPDMEMPPNTLLTVNYLTNSDIFPSEVYIDSITITNYSNTSYYVFGSLEHMEIVGSDPYKDPYSFNYISEGFITSQIINPGTIYNIPIGITAQSRVQLIAIFDWAYSPYLNIYGTYGELMIP